MSRLLVILLLVALVLLPLASVLARDVKCPECDSAAYFTGKTRVNSAGHLMHLYQCMSYRDHKFWVRAN